MLFVWFGLVAIMITGYVVLPHAHTFIDPLGLRESSVHWCMPSIPSRTTLAAKFTISPCFIQTTYPCPRAALSLLQRSPFPNWSDNLSFLASCFSQNMVRFLLQQRLNILQKLSKSSVIQLKIAAAKVGVFYGYRSDHHRQESSCPQR